MAHQLGIELARRFRDRSSPVERPEMESTLPAPSIGPTLGRSCVFSKTCCSLFPCRNVKPRHYVWAQRSSWKYAHNQDTGHAWRSLAANVSSTSTLAETEQLDIRVGSKVYPVYVGSGVLYDTQLFGRHIRGNHVLIITNARVSPLYLNGLVMAITNLGGRMNVEAVCLDDGEEQKNQDSVIKVINAAIEAKMDNSATFVGLGGGVINDLCGFAAACYQGGVNYIQIPTTLRAQVDISVADETGVYHLLDKKLICSYYEPECVFVETNTLATLPGKELISGITEIIKFALVRDAALLQWLKENMMQILERHTITIAHAIKRCCMIKSAVLLDGKRNILTLGQPFGRAILRSLEGNGTCKTTEVIGTSQNVEQGEWLHGEALAVGLVMAVDLSHRLKWVDDLVLMDTVIAMEKAHLPTAPPAYISKEVLKINMDLPHNGQPKLALLKGLGDCIFTEDYDSKALESMLIFFCLGGRM